jgi:hypothetical protein
MKATHSKARPSSAWRTECGSDESRMSCSTPPPSGWRPSTDDDRGRSTMPFAAGRSLGTDAVTVESATATQAAADQADAGNLLRGLGDLMGLKVVKQRGCLPGRRA